MQEIERFCPFGNKCEEIKNDKIYRCNWYIEIAGKNPQSEEIINKWVCSMAIMPILMIENAQTNRGQTVALESFRNEVIKQQEKLNMSIKNRIQTVQIPNIIKR